MHPTSHLLPSYDAVIVGARCAGAATAMLLARRGLRVLVIDRSRHGSDTVSTHALMRAGVHQLASWGLLDAVATAGTPAVRHTWFHYGDQSIEVPIRPRGQVEALYAPRRTVLDALLADAARDAGADVRFGIRLTDLTRDADGRVTCAILEDGAGGSARVDGGIVIGADGLRSAVAHLAGARTTLRGRHASGLLYGYFADLDVNAYHWHYAPGASAGAIPTGERLTCVFVAVPAHRFRDQLRGGAEAAHRQIISLAAPGLAPALARARLVGPLRGFAGEPGFLREAWGPGWALVGDAGYFRDPITAHGITDALRDAELLARAVAVGSPGALATYQATRDRVSADFLRATDAIASFSWDFAALEEHQKILRGAMGEELALLEALARPSVPSPQTQQRMTGERSWP